MKDTLRKLRLAIGKKLLDSSGKLKDIPFAEIKKILIVRSDGKIGDNIVSSFIFREIKKQRPDIEIHVVVSPSNVQMLSDEPNIDKYFILKNKGYSAMLKMAGLLKKEKYDVLFEPTTAFRNRNLLFTKIVGAKINIGYDKQGYKIFNKQLAKGHYQAFEIYKEMLQLLGFKDMDTTYRLPARPEIEQQVDTDLPGLNNIIAVNLFGVSRSRKFTKEKSIALIKIVLERYPAHQVVLLSFPAVNEFLTAVIAEIGAPNVSKYANSTTIFHSIALIKKAALVISPDTAIVHIAEALRKPLVAFYANDAANFIQWHPRYDAIVLRYDENVNNADLNAFKEALPDL